MKRVRLSEQALADLDDIWLYIAQDHISAADRFIDTLHQKCRELAESPGMGRGRDELAVGLRSLPVGNYVVFYRPMQGGIEVARILSGFRDLEALFGP